MTLGVGFLEVVDGELSVGCEGFDGGMAKKFFDVIRIGAIANEFGRTASTEGMGCEGDG